MPAEMLESMQQTEKHFEVWPENADVLGLFLKLQTQWRIINGIVVGLDYPSVGFMMDLYSVKDRLQTFDDIQAMEVAALAAMNRSRE